MTPYVRALNEGLFGYRPDYPNGIVRMEPSFPSSWEHASLRTPDIALAFKDRTYKLTLTRPAAVRFGIPVRAARVNGVTVNCRAVVYGWKLRPGVELNEITLETLSQDVVIGLMAASLMNTGEP